MKNEVEKGAVLASCFFEPVTFFRTEKGAKKGLARGIEGI
jgi:hypothetical protein